MVVILLMATGGRGRNADATQPPLWGEMVLDFLCGGGSIAIINVQKKLI